MMFIDEKSLEALKNHGSKGKITGRTCPLCGIPFVGVPALSRRDNKTEICSECATTEALEDFFNKKVF